jgi:MFS family permease
MTEAGRRSTTAKLGLLGSLYLSQGLPFGFFTQALPALMRQRGLSLEAIGLGSLLVIPWALKFAWAPIVDRRFSRRWGRRRSWILPLQLAAVVAMCVLAWIDPEASLWWLIAGVFVTNMIAATQDVATDGLAVDLLEPHERGWGNGIQVAGYRVGMIVGGSALLVVFEAWGWGAAFWIGAAVLLVSSLPIAFHSEAPAPRQPDTARPVWDDVRTSLRWFLDDPDGRRWLIVLGLYKAGDYVGTSMLRPFLVDRGLGLGAIGITLGAVGFAAGLLGAVVGGAWVARLGRRRALVGFGVLQALGVASYWFAVDSSLELSHAAFDGDLRLYGPIVFEHFVTEMATAALFTVMMDRCRPGHAATDYTVQASLVVAVTAVAATIGGFTASALDYGPNFLLGGGICLGAAALARGVVDVTVRDAATDVVAAPGDG